MTTSVLALLVALLCAETAQGLRCYQCEGTQQGDMQHSSCQQTLCPSPDGVCVSLEMDSIVESKEVKVQRKFCFPTCPENLAFTRDMLLYGTTLRSRLSCCQWDLCNAGARAGGSTWALAGGLLFSLGSIVSWALL